MTGRIRRRNGQVSVGEICPCKAAPSSDDDDGVLSSYKGTNEYMFRSHLYCSTTNWYSCIVLPGNNRVKSCSCMHTPVQLYPGTRGTRVHLIQIVAWVGTYPPTCTKCTGVEYPCTIVPCTGCTICTCRCDARLIINN